MSRSPALLLSALACACSADSNAARDPLGAPLGAPLAQQLPRGHAPAALPPVPSAKQLAWHELEHYAFVHFNMDTFTGNEWGSGNEDPRLFAPSALDCRQWARVARASGMQAIILTAKHHDGFCLWPSKYSEHTVAASPWRGGRGDVLRELSDACREQGLKFGLYLSPWDRNSKDYGTGAAYNEYFARQLSEVLTHYGPVFEVWFDGACGEGPNGKQQLYDWKLFHETVYRCQPEAVIFSDVGPDLRWMGNEQGFVGETNWAMLSPAGFEPGLKAPATDVLNQGQIDGTHWIPAECDVSIRPGWYYHAEQDSQVKSLEELQQIWFGSVGRGANLLLNLPVDRRGLVHENEVARLAEFKAWRDQAFGHPFEASFVPGAPGELDRALRHAHYRFDAPREIDLLELGEAIELGQRVAAFTLRGANGSGAAHVLARGTTIGRKRLLRIERQTLTDLWIEVEEARATPLLAHVRAHRLPPQAPSADAEPPLPPRKAVQFVRAPDPGLACELHLGRFQALAEIEGRAPSARAAVARPSFEPAADAQACALVFTGFVNVPRAGTYRFELTSADAARLWIGEQLVLEHDGLQGATAKRGRVGLEPGWHPLRIACVDAGGERVLELRLLDAAGGEVPLSFGH